MYSEKSLYKGPLPIVHGGNPSYQGQIRIMYDESAQCNSYILHSGIALDQGTQCLLRGRTTKYKGALCIVEIHYNKVHYPLCMLEVHHTRVKFA